MRNPKQKSDIKIWGTHPAYTKETFAKAVDEYIAHQKSKQLPITLSGFCIYAKVFNDYISEHDGHEKKHLDFSTDIKRLRLHAENYALEGGMTNSINHRMAMFTLQNNFGWSEKRENKNTGDTHTIINIVKPNADNLGANT